MISRRRFITGSLAVVASNGLLPRIDLTTHAQARPTLRLFFVGGSVFRRSGSNCLAVQPSGRGYVHPTSGHAMRHRSFMVAPKGLVKDAIPFPAGYPSKSLHPHLRSRDKWEVVCLEDRDVRVEHKAGPDFGYHCEKVADYHWLSGDWTVEGTWDDPSKPRGEAVSSRFVLTGGVLKDADPVNDEGADEDWVVGNGRPKELSDVAVLELTAEDIRISITGMTTPVSVTEDRSLYVFSGPEQSHGEEGETIEYSRIEHALLLHTLYRTNGAEVRPETFQQKKIRVKRGKKHTHPCDFKAGGAESRQRAFAPPDSEYCVNYNHLP